MTSLSVAGHHKVNYIGLYSEISEPSTLQMIQQGYEQIKNIQLQLISLDLMNGQLRDLIQ